MHGRDVPYRRSADVNRMLAARVWACVYICACADVLGEKNMYN